MHCLFLSNTDIENANNISLIKFRSKQRSKPFSSDETAPFFGFLGAAATLHFLLYGGSLGGGRKSIVPVFMAGVLGFNGLTLRFLRGCYGSCSFKLAQLASQDKKCLDVGANLFIGNLDRDADVDFKINWKRVAITSSFGFGFIGPVGHFWSLKLSK